METDAQEIASEELMEAFNSIPCGLCIYRFKENCLAPVYHNPAFDEMTGSGKECVALSEEKMSYQGVHPDDLPEFRSKVQQAICNGGDLSHTCRIWNKRKQEYRWIQMEVIKKIRENGTPFLYGVFTDVSVQRRLWRELPEEQAQRQVQLELEQLLKSIPGGIVSYRMKDCRLVPVYFSDGALDLSGYSREELWEITEKDNFSIVHPSDKERVKSAYAAALRSGEDLDISYRIAHKNGEFIWVHLNGRCLDPVGEGMRFYAVYTGMSPEARLFQSIACDMGDGIYVIGKENYDLLYFSENVKLFPGKNVSIGQKCYSAFHGKDAPCEFCTFNNQELDGMEHAMNIPGMDKFYNTRFREIDWNGIPAYVKYVRDVTKDVLNNRDRNRLEEYFETVVKNLPGGVAVIQHEEDGTMLLEYLSEGFADMLEMTVDQVWERYEKDPLAVIHPEDRDKVRGEIDSFSRSGKNQYHIGYRLKKGDGTFVWVKNTLSTIQNAGGGYRIYAAFQDITAEREEQEQLIKQYNEEIIEHYHAGGPDALIAGNCNITRDRILDMSDQTNSGLLEAFGSRRDDFFSGVASLLVDEEDRREFRNTYLNAPALAAYERGETEKIQRSFVKLPGEAVGRYLQFRVNMIKEPATNDITGVLTVTDITEETISNRILHHLSVVSYDLIEDVDLENDHYKILTGINDEAFGETEGCHSKRIERMLKEKVLPKDRKRVADMLDQTYLLNRLEREGSYSFHYSIVGNDGEICAKNMTVSASDLRLRRICLARTDITESVQEQRRLLNIIAYTFEMLAFIDIEADHLTLYTRQAVLENLPPYTMDHYNDSLSRLADVYDPDGQEGAIEKYFRVETLLKHLEESPGGYDFVLPYHMEGRVQYKQINVLWGDDRRTICMVRADVTDMIAAERNANEALEKALVLAEEASQAKSDFLSSMSHDIRTPLNAITGMTALAMAHLEEKDRVGMYLDKIVLASKHLLSLINDILDMNSIERSRITLGRARISMEELMVQLSDLIGPQAEDRGVKFYLHMKEIEHWYFYGDALRINQILINLLGNAVKFTPEGGRVYLTVREIEVGNGETKVRYLFEVCDTGMGMPEEFLAQVFEPFTRGRNVAKVEGSGLGLSIVNGLVRLMGGTISVDSRLNQGTTFRIELEFEASKEGEEKQEENPAVNGGSAASGEESLAGRQFLVVEDNAINAEILVELLQMYGARTVVAGDGIQALEEFKNAAPETYDAVLMDIQMPGMDGYEATRRIRSLDRRDAKSIPIIAMTANAFEEDVREALKAGMTAHVSKPIDIQLFWKTLGQILSDAGGSN